MQRAVMPGAYGRQGSESSLMDDSSLFNNFKCSHKLLK